LIISRLKLRKQQLRTSGGCGHGASELLGQPELTTSRMSLKWDVLIPKEGFIAIQSQRTASAEELAPLLHRIAKIG
jgi:hypothetical protein